MAVGDVYVFPGFLTPVLTQLFFPKPPTTFLTCPCRGERRKYAGKKSRLNRGSNSQPPCQKSDTLTTEPPGRGWNLVLARDTILGIVNYTIKNSITKTLSQTNPGFYVFLQSFKFLNTVGKGEIARNEKFLLFPQCFQKTSTAGT